MISTSAAFVTAVNSDSRSWSMSLTDTNGTAIAGDIVSAKIRRGACGENFAPGAIYVPYIELTVKNLASSLDGQTIVPVLTLATANGPESITLGHYIVAGPKETSGAWSITGYGLLSQALDVTYTSALTYPATISSILAEMSTALGVSISLQGLTGTGYVETNMSGLTMRQALEVIASLLGGFVTENNTGGIVIAKFMSGSSLAVPASRSIAAPQYNEAGYEVTGLTCVVTEDQESPDGTVIPGTSMTSGSPVNVTIENSFMTNTLFTDCAANFVGIQFEPGTVDMALGDPRLDPWDYLTVTDLAGTTHTVPCLSIAHEYTGGFETIVSAPIDSDSEQKVTVLGPVQQTIKKLQRQVGYLQVAGQNAQYFWHNQDGQDVSTGTYITEVPEATFRADPANGGGNTHIRSNGLALRNGVTELASFTANGVQIGQDNATNIRIAPNGLILSNDAQAIVLNVSTDGGTESSQKTIAARSLELGTATSSWGPKAQYANGSISTEYDLSDAPAGVTIGLGSPAEPTVTLQGFGYIESITTPLEQSESGGSSNPPRWWANAWGQRAATITQGVSSTNTLSVEVALTNGGLVSGTQTIDLIYEYVASTGVLTVTMSVQEPFDNMTRVAYARVDLPTISYTASIAAPAYLFGTSRDSLGSFSLASGEDVYASSANQVALGKYNVQDQADDYAFILGNGSDDANRSNALTVDWNGAIVAAGSITAEGHSSAIGTIESSSATVSVSSGTSWARQTDTALPVDPGTWLVIASSSCPGSTTGDRALGITYGSATGNLVQSRTTMRANAGSGIAAMQTTMVVATNTATRTYTIEYWQNSGAAKSVDFRLTAVRLS